MTDEYQPTLTSIHVSQFTYCCCGAQPYSETHLAVRTFSIRLDNRFAVAVSYGIGDFDRESLVVGHRKNNPAVPVRLSLAGEWVIVDFIAALVRLSKRKGSVWLDQLSIPQEPEAIARQLQEVPDIYATLEVVVLLPNSPCPCLSDLVRSYEAGDADGTSPLLHAMQDCLHAFPFASYFSRLWTKLEFRYSCELAFWYCRGPPGPCFIKSRRRLGLQMPDLRERPRTGRYLGTLYPQLATGPPDNLGNLGNNQLTNLALRFTRDVDLYSDGAVKWSDLELLTAKLLLGTTLKRPPVSPRSPASLSFAVYNDDRQATVPADLITAVFVHHSRYRIPTRHRQMIVPALLENALELIEVGVVYLSSLPQGLFSVSRPGQNLQGSMYCKPASYLQTDSEIRLRDIYVPLGYTPVSILERGTLMLRYYTTQEAGSSKMLHATSYRKVFGAARTHEVFEFLFDLPVQLRGRIATCTTILSDFLTSPSLEGLVRERQHMRQVADSRRETSRLQWPDRSRKWTMLIQALAVAWDQESLSSQLWSAWDLPEIDHHDAVYFVMCTAAGIDPQVARAAGIELVVQTGRHANIGLISRQAYELLRNDELAQPALSQMADSGEQRLDDSGVWLSVRMQPRPGFASLVYETRRVVEGAEGREAYEAGHSMTSYAVVGVWLECPPDDPYIGAEVTEDRKDFDVLLV